MGRRVHSAEFKREAAKLALQPGKAKVQVARELGVHINVLRLWIKQFQAGVWGRRRARGSRASSSSRSSGCDGN
jgi:transposase